MSAAHLVWALLVVVGLVNCVTFVVGYHMKSSGRWRRHPMGRHLMGFVAVLGVAFSLMAASLFGVSLSPAAWIVTLGLINVALAQRNWLLFTSGWRSRNDANK